MTVAIAEHAAIDITLLRSRFRGALLRPGEEGYDETRRIWNGAFDRRPAVIARCVGADDVAEAVRFARERDLLVSVRGGGHAVAGHAVCDDGLMIDLSLMRSVQVDPVSHTARVAGGALWSDVDKVAQSHGLAVTGGIISHTGVGGLTLGGGLGHLMRKFGLTVDSLLSADLVTAAGERLHVSADSNPELFWGLRGGGGNFGVVTSFEYQLHPVGPTVLAGPVFWRLSDGPDVLRFLRDFAPDAPDDLGITIAARLAPPMPFVPKELVGSPIFGLILVWAGDHDEGRRVIEPLLKMSSPIAEVVRPTPYVAIQTLLDASAAHGNHYYWKSHRIPLLSEGAIEAIVQGVETMTSPMSQISGWAIGGAASRVAPDATAVGAREVGFELNVTAAWQPSNPDGARHVAWVRETWEQLRADSVGVYANFLSDEDQAGVEAAYGQRLARLTAVKDRYDPTNLFRMNANIRPSARPHTGRTP
ncbi:MAG TPA: FAD-binding oxidoreductase [Thermomicrobiales bacterium]|nr:FAD-binding oxidoreductase [Thermomicrobiales bacterium]